MLTIYSYINLSGGLVPCLKAIKNATEGTGLVLDDATEIGKYYAETLHYWLLNW